MNVIGGKLSLAALSLAALGFLSAPIGALAQDEPPGENQDSTAVSNKIVKLDLESADLYYALKLLFSQIKADFTLPPDLRGTLVTVRLNQPFRVALESLLKASGLPITWRMENGVYNIVPIVEDQPQPQVDIGPEEGPEAEPRSIPRRLRVNNVSGIDIVAALGGRFIPWTGSGQFVGYNPMGGGMGGMMGGMGGMGGMMGGMGGMMGGMGGMGGMMGGMGGMGGMMGGMGGMGGFGGGMGGMMGGMGGMGGFGGMGGIMGGGRGN